MKQAAVILAMTILAFIPLRFATFPAPEPPAPVDTVFRARIVAAGDLMQHMPQVAAARLPDGGYDYTPSFRHVARHMREADLAIVNLETTLSDNGPYSGYPCFRSPAEVADAMHAMGVDLAVMANNHCCDRGAEGIRSTLEILDSRGIRRTGVYRDSVDRSRNNIQIFERNGISFAVVNYTYGTNGLPVPKGMSVNMLDTAAMARDLAAIDRSEVDCVIAAVHWGDEYRRSPAPSQTAAADFLKRCGADIIIGSHPHVVQGVEYDPARGVTLYSLGNFVSNQRKRYCDGGLIAAIDVERINRGPLTYRLTLIPVWVHTPDYAVIPPEVGDTMAMDADSRRRYDIFMDDTRKLLGI